MRPPPPPGWGREKVVDTRKGIGCKEKSSDTGAGKRGRLTKAEQLAKAHRPRANSVGIIEELNRKREREEKRTKEDRTQQPFKKSAKTQRSPIKNSTYNMDNQCTENKEGEEEKQTGSVEGEKDSQTPWGIIMKELQGMRQEMKQEFEKDRNESRKERSELRNEIKKLREEMTEKGKNWERKYLEAEERAKKLEERLERLEGREKKGMEDTEGRLREIEEKATQIAAGKRGPNQGDGDYLDIWKAKLEQLDRNWEATKRRERKNNIIVRGKKWPTRNEKEEIEKLLREELNTDAKARRVRVLGNERNMAVVEMESWEDKAKVRRMKKELKDKGQMIFIDNDYTQKEREIQRKLVTRAKKEKEKGAQVKVGYMKIQIQGKWWFWNEVDGEIREERNFRNGRGTTSAEI
ncbi:trichohyalin-like [Osmia bicornis bicornis]|uniref:trichohyalin-like n=1 Tax=Osmia bicornis bicornis TaxID=1437191 RepID=UPI001EAF3043|nr:trichohyalin-like [Osmia bicornis bicornis]